MRRTAAVPFLLALCLGCGGRGESAQPEDAGQDVSDAPGEASPDASPEAPPSLPLRATARQNPKMVIGALVDVETTPAVSVWVEHLDGPAAGKTTPSVDVPASGKVTIPVIALEPKKTAHLRVHAKAKDGATAVSDDLPVDAGSLPFDLGSGLDVVTTTPGLDGYVLLGLSNAVAKVDIDVMIDRQGRILWYWLPPGAPTPGHVARYRGHFLAPDSPSESFHELDLANEEFHAWTDPTAEGIDTHDFLPLPGGHALMIGWSLNTCDTRPYFPGGVADATRRDHTVDEIDETGKLVFRWSTYPAIGLDEVVLDPTDPTVMANPRNLEVAHLNSIETWPDGDILASMRKTNSLVRIDRKTGGIKWRLGGKKSDFTVVGDPWGGFSRQHDARLHGAAADELSLLDNGNMHSPRETRVVRYKLDETAKTATLVWEWHHTPPLYSAVAGSARWLPSGNVLVDFSVPGVITEIDPKKATVWEVKIGWAGAYRAIWVPTLYGP